jgi:hypothetical protein
MGTVARCSPRWQLSNKKNHARVFFGQERDRARENNNT